MEFAFFYLLAFAVQGHPENTLQNKHNLILLMRKVEYA